MRLQYFQFMVSDCKGDLNIQIKRHFVLYFYIRLSHHHTIASQQGAKCCCSILFCLIYIRLDHIQKAIIVIYIHILRQFGSL